MPDKRISPAAWLAFSKGGSFKDAALIGALRVIAKAADDLAAVSVAISEALAASKLLRKTHRADKRLASQLDGVEDGLLDLQKSVGQLERERLKAASKGDAELLPPALGKAMAALLRKVRAGEDMHSMIGVAGADIAVLVSRRPVGPPQAALLKKHLGAGGAVKVLKGTCIFEANAHTFVLQKAIAGLAKKLKQALYEQTGLRTAVRVRGAADGMADGASRLNPG